MKKPSPPVLLTAVVAVAALAIVLFRQANFIPPSILVEHFAPILITDEAWRKSVANDPTAHGYSAYGILQDRASDIAINEGLRDLTSNDPYVWMNAASYLGSRGRKASVPYLIKALRHTAWRSDDERIQFLVELTGQAFGNNFDQWREWYLAQPNPIDIDWDSSLGHYPR